ncbi:Glycosyl transferase domain containing protein [Aphelenchoides besseyi]|nr:Glycosyl transferase domain containing protein [Aphelenchoides besseyi]
MFLIIPLVFGPFLAILAFALRTVRIQKRKGIAFVHPYCEAGGGGEVVLWEMIKTISDKKLFPEIFVYTKQMTSEEEKEIKRRICERFKIKEWPSEVEFVQTRFRHLLEPQYYPRFTLFCQQFVGALVFSLECLFRLTSEYVVESTGIPVALPVFKCLGGSKVLVYMHYPTITNNMITRVTNREEIYNNAEFIARSQLLTNCKLWYYRFFAFLYQLCGRCTDCLLVNGSFTANHIRELWNCNPELCYPPVNLNSFRNLNSTAEEIWTNEKKLNIVSLAQFRPEKNHSMQLETLAELKRNFGNTYQKCCLVMIGGVRNDADRAIVENLHKQAEKLGLKLGEDYRIECEGYTLEEIRSELENSMIAIHTMLDEHFGIAVVELMAAGLITITHKSGGPNLDIIADLDTQAGFLGENDPKSYAEIIDNIMNQTANERNDIREAAKQRAKTFGLEKFQENIENSFKKLKST